MGEDQDVENQLGAKSYTMYSFRSLRTIILSTLWVFLVQATVLHAALAQERVEFSGESSLFVDGTSNQSDWTVTAENLTGWVELAATDAALPEIVSAEVHVVVREIKSNRSPIMDRLMYRTLKSTEFDEIVFVLTSVGDVEIVEARPDSFNVSVAGNLTIAGVTHEIQTTVGGLSLGSSGFRFAGRYELKMTDYGMQPPTALFGALHTGDGVVVHFDLVAITD